MSENSSPVVLVDDTTTKVEPETKPSELKLYFSLISGELYYIEADEVKNQEDNQMPLTKKPDPNCNQCYGRFYIGREVNKNYYMPCPRCSRKCVDWEQVTEAITIASTKQTTEMDDEFSQAVSQAIK